MANEENMGTPRFSIPEEYQHDLEYVESLDTRSDEDILASITKFQPVEGEKNIWTFWDSGIRSMPKWCQRNIINWARLNGPDWTIRLLDNVPESPNYALKYIPAEMMPDCYVHGTMDGLYHRQHTADFVRAACMSLHGGAYLDSSIMLFRSLQDLCWTQIEDPASPIRICTTFLSSYTAGNFFVACRKQDPFMKRWHDLFTHVWQDRTNHIGVSNHPLLRFTYAIPRDGLWAGPTEHLAVDQQDLLDYGAQMIAWQRVCLLEDVGDGFSGIDYAQHHILWLNYLTEALSMAQHEGPNGFQDPLDALASRYDADPTSTVYQAGYRLVWELLSRATMQKVWTGQGLTSSASPGTFWTLEEQRNEPKDAQPGTFAELLRYGSVHFAQKRRTVDSVRLEKSDYAMRKGLLEA